MMTFALMLARFNPTLNATGQQIRISVSDRISRGLPSGAARVFIPRSPALPANRHLAAPLVMPLVGERHARQVRGPVPFEG